MPVRSATPTDWLKACERNAVRSEPSGNVPGPAGDAVRSARNSIPPSSRKLAAVKTAATAELRPAIAAQKRRQLGPTQRRDLTGDGDGGKREKREADDGSERPRAHTGGHAAV